MGLAIAVEGAVVTIDSPYTGTVTIQTPPSAQVKADAKGVYSGDLSVTLSGVTGPNFQAGAGSGTISPLALKVKAGDKLVIRLNDVGTGISVVGTDMNVPPAPSTVTCSVTVTDSGQTKVLAE